MEDFFFRFLDHFYASYTRQILLEAVRLLGQLWIYLVLGIVLSTVVKIFVSKQQMTEFFSRKNHSATIIIAALLGVISPVGSYVIIPMAAALLVIGVPLPALRTSLIREVFHQGCTLLRYQMAGNA